MTEVVVTAGGDVVVETLNDVLVVLTLDEPNVIATPAEQGPPGPQGPVGPAGSVYMTYTAGITLSGHKAVQIDGTGAAVYVDSGTVADAGRVLGITINAALLGAAAAIVTAGAQRRKLDAEAGSTVESAAQQVVALLRGELDAMTARLHAETARCDALARRVERLEQQLAARGG